MSSSTIGKRMTGSAWSVAKDDGDDRGQRSSRAAACGKCRATPEGAVGTAVGAFDHRAAAAWAVGCRCDGRRGGGEGGFDPGRGHRRRWRHRRAVRGLHVADHRQQGGAIDQFDRLAGREARNALRKVEQAREAKVRELAQKAAEMNAARK